MAATRNVKLRLATYIVALLVALIIAWNLFAPANAGHLMPGEFNPGHEALDCADCHTPEQGTARQQMQAVTSHAMGWRESDVNFGSSPVSNSQCVDCHDRPNDRHAVARFLEPKYSEARAELAPQLCSSCHLEHSAKRVSWPDGEYCQQCHEDTKLNQDPVMPSHQTLVENNQWETCLQCHDYHGNHQFEEPQTLGDAFSLESVADYMNSGPPPYGDDIQFKAKKSQRGATAEELSP